VGVRAKALWADPRRSVWSPQVEGAPDDETFPPELYAQLVAAVAAHPAGFPHAWATAQAASGPRSPRRACTSRRMPLGTRAPPQLIPAWMFTLASDYLRTHGHLSNRYLPATDGLNVKRSSAVCAILARLPGVEYTTIANEGIVLTWAVTS
jgi:hypothetical protein